MPTWLPEKRAKYNAKRRQKDLDFVYSNWNLPKEMAENKINIAYVPSKVAKKYKRVVAVHEYGWRTKNDEYNSKFQEMNCQKSESFAFALCASTLEQMRKVLPTYQSFTIVDIPPDFRKFSSDICDKEISGKNRSALCYLFWNNYRLAYYYQELGGQTNYEISLRYANEALSLLPTLQKGEIPHYEEVYVRTARALAYFEMMNYEATLVEYRVIFAAIRLLHHEGRLDMSDPNNKLMGMVNVWPHTLMRMTIQIKIQNGVSRPYLTKDEYLDLMKENAYGIYSHSSQKCFNCGKTENLLLCSGCSNAWYCGKSCATKAWKAEHKHRCGSKRYSGTLTIPASFFPTVLGEIESKVVHSMGMSILNFGDRDFLVLCKDPCSGEIFDALTDETIEIQEGIPLFSTKSKLGGYHHFHGVPAKSPSQE